MAKPGRARGLGGCRHAGNAPVIVVIPVHHTMVWRDVVIELVEHPARRRLRRRRRIRAGLRLVVVLVLERSEEPELVANERTGHLCGPVPPAIAMIGQAGCRTIRHALALLRGGGVAARQALSLPVVRGIAVKRVASLARDNVEHGTDDIAVLGRCAELQDFDLLDRVRIRPWPGGASRRRGQIGAVDRVQVVVGGAAQDRRRGARPERRGRAHARRRVDQVEKREMPDRRGRDPRLVVVAADGGGCQVDHGRLAGDRDRLAQRADLERDVQLDDRPDAHRDGIAPQRAEALERVFDAVVAGRRVQLVRGTRCRLLPPDRCHPARGQRVDVCVLRRRPEHVALRENLQERIDLHIRGGKERGVQLLPHRHDLAVRLIRALPGAVRQLVLVEHQTVRRKPAQGSRLASITRIDPAAPAQSDSRPRFKPW